MKKSITSLLIELKFFKLNNDNTLITYSFENKKLVYYINYLKLSKKYVINIYDENGILSYVDGINDVLNLKQVIKFLKTRKEFISYFRKKKIDKLLNL